MSRVLGRLPASTLVVGIEGHRFEIGEPPAPEVRAAVHRAAEFVRAEIAPASRGARLPLLAGSAH